MTEPDRRKLFGEIAVEKGMATPGNVEECLEAQKSMAELGMPQKIGEIMAGRGIISAGQVAEVLAAQSRKSVKDIIDGYEIISKLGQGGMGAVFKARKTDLDRIVALKILPPKYSEDGPFLKRFMREAKLAAQLNHPSIVGCIDAGVSNGHYFLAMEFAEGRTLQDVLKDRGFLPEAEALEITRQAAHALKHAQSKGLVHRDIKPGNIILQGDGAIKLCDMGLAKDVLSKDESNQITQAGVAVGTPYYISPEQAQGLDEVDWRADVYSLGATLFHLLTGDVPFRASSPAAVLVKHFSEPLVPPRKANPAVSPAASRLVEIMMAKSPEARFGSPSDLIEAVEKTMRGEIPEAPGVPDETRACRSPSGSGFKSAAAIAAKGAVTARRELSGLGRSRFFLAAAALSAIVSAVAVTLIITRNQNRNADEVRPTWSDAPPAPAPKPAETDVRLVEKPDPGKKPAPLAEADPAMLKQYEEQITGIEDQIADLRSDFEALRNALRESGRKPGAGEKEIAAALGRKIEEMEKKLKEYSDGLAGNMKDRGK